MLSGLWRIVLLAGVAACFISTASAQNVTLDAPGFLPPKPSAGPPPPRAQPTVWPRLDPGSVLCHTEDDLDQYAANLTARVSGGETQAADCRVITQATGIQILTRHGLGSTQVKLNVPGNVVGWTNVWLPDRAPAAR